MKTRVLIGLECHLQLRTRSKMFSPCPVRYGAPPNTVVDPFVLGLPGTLPVPNREAILMALALATALGCELAEVTSFDRKHYFYPDLAKGYQISQHKRPLGRGGGVEILTREGGRKIRLRQIHIEEDSGKNIHDEASSRIDYNRGGTPLVEIVSEPEIASPEEARAYVGALRTLARYLSISDANMEQGNLRCEPNVNLHIARGNQVVVTPVVELKNINSPRQMERAIRCEIERQEKEFEERGAAMAQAPRSTRGYDEARNETFLLRIKERAGDYRFFPEPDIPPILIGKAWRAEAAARVPELPNARRRRFEESYALSPYDADLLCREKTTADYFEEVVSCGAPPKPAANWISGELSRHAKGKGVEPAQLGLGAAALAGLVRLVEEGGVARRAAVRQVLPRLLDGTLADAAGIVEELGLKRLDDKQALRAVARQAIEEHPDAAHDLRAGRQKAFGALMGAVMRQTGGKANPALVEEVLRELLEENH